MTLVNVYDPLLYSLSAGGYVALTAYTWWRAGYAVVPTNAHRRIWPLILLAVALLCHGLLLHETIFRDDSMVFGFAYALSVMLWLGVAMYWLELCLLPMTGMGLVLLPSAVVAVLLPLLAPGSRVLANPASPLFKTHFIVANMAYGMLALAAFHALLMLLVERRLHGLGRAHGLAWLGRWLDTMPPLLTMERLLFKQISLGFVLLTLTIVSGVWFAESFWGSPLRFDHKTIFALISWAMFGALLLGRRYYGWRSRTALRGVLLAFAVLLLAYVGSRFVIEILLHRV